MRVCNLLYALRWYRDVPFSDIKRMFRFTSNASECSSWSSWYTLSAPWFALTLRRRCQHSTSLLVRIGWRNTDQVDGGQTVLSIHCRLTYCKWVATWTMSFPLASNSRKASEMQSAGRNGNAIVFLHIRLTASSFVYATCRPTAWILRQTAWVKWKAQPRWVTPGSTFLTACQNATSTHIMVL